MSSTNILPNAMSRHDADDIGPGGVIVIPTSAYNIVIRDIRKDRKISAIKACRSSYHELVGRRLGLRSAKQAVERLKDELNSTSPDNDNRPRLQCGLSIAGVVVNTGTEKVEVDLEELQLRILSDIKTLGLAECGRILELVEVFQAWNDGKRIGIIDHS